MNFEPIGIFHTSKKHSYDAARQPVHDPASVGEIELNPGQNFEQAVIGLEKFSHVWILFCFHQNQNWKPMVRPPRGSDTKQGVFATRAPYRPNPIGMSVVKLVKIDGRKIWVEGHDLLNDTPILDIKPYVPSADVIDDASSGWIQNENLFHVGFSAKAKEQLEFLKSKGVVEVEGFLKRELESSPQDYSRKRVKKLGPNFQIAYRTWRAEFVVEDQSVEVLQIRSGYTALELEKPAGAGFSDPYQDQQLHLDFIRRWSQSTEQSED